VYTRLRPHREHTEGLFFWIFFFAQNQQRPNAKTEAWIALIQRLLDEMGGALVTQREEILEHGRAGGMACRIGAHSAKDIQTMWDAFSARDAAVGFSLSRSQAEAVFATIDKPPNAGVYFEVFDPQQVDGYMRSCAVSDALLLISLGGSKALRCSPHLRSCRRWSAMKS
jgi:hypothetical protein